MPKLEYPKILTNKDWQSKKATLDKVGKGKKTGVGEALDSFQAAYAKSVFAKDSANLKLIKDTYDPIVFKNQLGPMRKGFMDDRKKLEPQVVSLTKKLDDAIKALGPSNASAKHLVKVKDALRQFNLTGMAEHINQVERAAVSAYAARLQKSMAFGFVIDKGNPGRRNVQPYKEQLGKCATLKDIDFYFNPGENSANPPGRALSTLCQNWDQVITADFPEYAKKYYAGSAMETALRANKWLPDLSTPATSGTTQAVAKLQAELQKGGRTEEQVVTQFRQEALASFTKAEKFLNAYFNLIDTMPKHVKEL